LGFTVYPQRRRLKRRKVVYFRRKLTCLMAGHRAGQVDAERVRASVEGWAARACYGNTMGLRKSILREYIREVAWKCDRSRQP
jgi:hypothetical protein